MDVAENGGRLVVRLDPGGQVMEKLETLRERYNLRGAFFTGIGAVDRATLGHYDVEEQEYHEREVEGQFEVTNFTGNIGPDKIHAHITLGERDFGTIGGHCASARVSGTFELIVLRAGMALPHARDERTGLDVFDI